MKYEMVCCFLLVSMDFPVSLRVLLLFPPYVPHSAENSCNASLFLLVASVFFESFGVVGLFS